MTDYRVECAQSVHPERNSPISAKAGVIARVCEALSAGSLNDARTIATTEYPGISVRNTTRRYSEKMAMLVFVRDGFVDRYSGDRLVMPGALRLLSKLLPDAFPAHPNWKMSETHIVYWELSPTVDHVVPVARGGVDTDENIVTTSMLRNSAKAHWTLDELGWALLPVGDINVWDGLTSWFLAYVNSHRECASEPYIGRWLRAATPIPGGEEK